MFDVGLLTHMLGLSYQETKQQAFEYKGFIAENFVQQEWAAIGLYPTYSWQRISCGNRIYPGTAQEISFL